MRNIVKEQTDRRRYLLRQVDLLGKTTYGERWPAVLNLAAAWVTGIPDAKGMDKLSVTDLETIHAQLKIKQRDRMFGRMR